MKCPHCDVSLSAHRNGKLICHYCGYEEPMIKVCPSCGSRHVGGFKAGTQQIEDLVKREFPEARVLRMDMDTTKNKDGHERILSAFADGEADILVGTQMIVKGHDFPAVTLVGGVGSRYVVIFFRLQIRGAYIPAACAGSWSCGKRKCAG